MRDPRSVFVFLLGLALCVGIWVAVPYNNFALNNSFVSDGYLPEIVLLCIAFLVLVLNPLLRRFLPGLALTHRHLALLVGMMLFGAILPSNGLFRFFPHNIARETEIINRYAAIYVSMAGEGAALTDCAATVHPDPAVRMVINCANPNGLTTTFYVGPRGEALPEPAGPAI